MHSVVSQKGTKTLQVRQSRGLGALLSVPVFNHERVHVYSDSMQIIKQTITYSGAASGFKVES